MNCEHCGAELARRTDNLGIYCPNTHCIEKAAAKKCPKCQSTNIIVLIAFIGSGIYICRDCNYDWEGSIKL